MDENLTIKTAEEWAQLSEVSFPQIEYANQKGMIYEVRKTGGLWVEEHDCKGIDINQAYSERGRYLLPTIVVLDDGQDTLMRLPLQTGGWVTGCLWSAAMGENLLPSQIESCVFNGAPCIEFVSII